jgi:hypothetical protein
MELSRVYLFLKLSRYIALPILKLRLPVAVVERIIDVDRSTEKRWLCVLSYRYVDHQFVDGGWMMY